MVIDTGKGMGTQLVMMERIGRSEHLDHLSLPNQRGHQADEIPIESSLESLLQRNRRQAAAAVSLQSLFRQEAARRARATLLSQRRQLEHVVLEAEEAATAVQSIIRRMRVGSSRLHQMRMEIHALVAVKIQSVYRGYSVRKREPEPELMVGFVSVANREAPIPVPVVSPEEASVSVSGRLAIERSARRQSIKELALERRPQAGLGVGVVQAQ
jgi:hypothetical protein